MTEPGRTVRERPGRGARPATEVVEITEIGAGGVGVGRLADGRVVFVAGTATGEQVLVRPVAVRKDWARARLLRVLRPGPGRRAAPCPLAGRCGGCTLQHLDYQRQLEAKSGIVARALLRIGGIDRGPIGVDPSPLEFGYRNRVSFSLLRLGSGRVVAGFHALQDPARIIDVGAECLLPEDTLPRAWAALRREWGHNAERLPAGNRLRLTLRASMHGEITLLVEGGYGVGRPAELLERVPDLAAVWQRSGRGSRPRILAGTERVAERWGGEDAGIAGSAFLQVNRLAAARLEEWIVERAGPVAGRRVVDAYCGIGTHGHHLARLGAEVTGIELDPDAVAEGKRLAGESVRFLEGRVEDHLPAVLPADLVIVNPPRTGLAAPVCGILSQARPPRLLYVSCDPATLARDLGRLQGRLSVGAVRCFDLFPQTAHVETVVELECATT